MQIDSEKVREALEECGVFTGHAPILPNQVASILRHTTASHTHLLAENKRLREALEAILDAPIIYTGAIEEPMRTCGIGGVTKLVKNAEAALRPSKGCYE